MTLFRACRIAIVPLWAASVVAATAGAGPPADAAAPAAQAAPPVSYVQVHAILHERCVSCHTPAKRRGELLLETYEQLMAGGESGPAVVPGRSAESLLVLMLDGTEQPQMPYREPVLPEEEIAVLRAWVDAGAPAPTAAELAELESAVSPIPDIEPLVPVTGAVAAVAFDAGAPRLAAAGYRSVHLLDLSARHWQRRLDGHADLVRAVAFSADGRWLAAAGGRPGRSGEIKLWDARTGTLAHTLTGHTDAVHAVAFSASGGWLASAGYDRLIKLWDVAEGREIRTLEEHTDAVFALAFLPDGRHVASASGDRTIKIWDAGSGRRLFTIGDALDAVYALAVDPSGRRIAAAGEDRILRVWEWGTGGGHHGAAGPQAVLRRSTFAHADAIVGVAWSPDGTRLVTTGADRRVKIWDADTLRAIGELEAQPDWGMGIAVSPDGGWLAVGRYDGTLGLYPMSGRQTADNFTVPTR